MATIAVLGTFDTKGNEHAFVANLITARGHKPLLIDAGTGGRPKIKPDIPSATLARAGGSSMKDIKDQNDRGAAVAIMAQGAPEILKRLAEKNRIQGVVSLGGGGGTSICTAAMRALPIGFPKVMVSTMASGDVSPYVGVTDVVMIPSIVDIAGLNRISRLILTNAAGAICGMVETDPPPTNDKPIIVASMFGNTTDCVSRARLILEKAGYEVLIFHSTGSGGRTMESLIASGMVAGVLDITTTEWADELLGGVLGAGPERLEAAARHGVPAIVAPGCLDMVNFGPHETIPEKLAHRNFYQHNREITLMRTSAEECAELGQVIGKKISASTGPVTFMIPQNAVSIISAPDARFHDPIADKVLFQAIRAYLRDDIPVIELPHEINDQTFAEACANELLANIAKADSGK
jgi:uncharacterized protein (UPF0261 family)